MTAAARGTVLVAASSAQRAVPYVTALAAGGIPMESIRVVAAAGGSASAGVAATPGSGAGAAPPAPIAGPHQAIAVAAAGLEHTVAELAAGAAGLVLCGGDDVEPRRYGEEPLPGAGVEAVPERDALEWELLAAARARRLPVWAICRGFQVLNVFLGGSLWQDLQLQRPSAVAHDPGPPNDRLAHSVRVLAPETPLGERLAASGASGGGGAGGADGAADAGGTGGALPRVNSRHHQGIKRLGDGLVAVAAAEDGLIEAAVLGDGAGGGGMPLDGSAGGWWVRGVEWHPENLLALPEQLALWSDFAAAVRSREGRA